MAALSSTLAHAAGQGRPPQQRVPKKWWILESCHESAHLSPTSTPSSPKFPEPGFHAFICFLLKAAKGC